MGKNLSLKELGVWLGFDRDINQFGKIYNIPRANLKNKVMWHGIVNNYDKILIIGYPKSGKSTLFELLVAQEESPEHFHLHTDDYKEYPYVEQLYLIMDELRDKERWIVEGIQGYRLLRKYAQLNDDTFRPDLIIIVKNISIDPKHERMVKGLTTIWNGYAEIEHNMPERILYVRYED